MECPSCREQMGVDRTKNLGTEIVRTRRCVNGHSLQTREAIDIEAGKDVLIRRYDGTAAAFSQREFVRRLDQSTDGMLSQRERTEAWEAARRSLIGEAEPDVVDGQRRLIAPSSAIGDATLRFLRHDVENRLAHVMYAVSYLGRVDLPSGDDEDPPLRAGWHNAADLLAWLFRSEEPEDAEERQDALRARDRGSGGGYGDLRQLHEEYERVASSLLTTDISIQGGDSHPVQRLASRLHSRALHEAADRIARLRRHDASTSERAAERDAMMDAVLGRLMDEMLESADPEWIKERLLPQVPALVTKNRRYRVPDDEEHTVERRPFNFVQFRRSILKALYGRRSTTWPNEPENERLVLGQLIASWVLMGLRGQHVVTAGQLATRTMRVLRRVDDLAYLNYAVRAKSMQSVSDITTEALGLVTHPSRPLVFLAEPRPWVYYGEAITERQVILVRGHGALTGGPPLPHDSA